MSSPWLSILVPVYNVEPWLRECVESVVSQMDSDIEFILLEDCSTDNSLLLLQQLATEFPAQLKLLHHQHNRGLSAARNSLLNAAKGEYIWFLDSDDRLHPGAIKSLRHLTEQHTPDLVMCDFSVLRENQKFKHRWRGENHVSTFIGIKNQLQTDPIKLFEGIYRARNLHVWSKISRRSLWSDDLRFPEGKVMEDMVVTPRLALRVKRYFYQPHVWVAYRQREGSILENLNQKKIDDMSVACAGVLEDWIKQYPYLSRQAQFAFCYFCVKTHICITRSTRKLHQAPDPHLQIYRQRFFDHIRWSKTDLCWEYIKRGWLLRLNRFVMEH